LSLVNEVYGEKFKKTPFQVLIQLDRYTIKELDTSKLQVGDVIVGVYDDSDPDYPKKDFGLVTALRGEFISFFGEMTGQEYTIPIRRIYIPIDWKWSDSVERMVKGATWIDYHFMLEHDKNYERKLRDSLFNERLVPGGRIQASLGAYEAYRKDLNLTAYNCYVIPSPEDSRKGILETLSQMSEIMARGGGVGINISTLRPKYAKVLGVNGTSSGAVSWGGVYSYVTGLIEQGGSRRGALMLQLHCTHPDIFTFINVKRQKGQIENANLSVQMTEEFIQAVENDDDWHLIFPDTRHPEYEGWASTYKDIHDWLEAGLPVEIYQTVKARGIFETLAESAWASGEPGFVVYDRMNEGRMSPTQRLIKQDSTDSRELYISNPKVPDSNVIPWNNTYYYQKNVAMNPCGEQSLTPWGICNLVHLNLSEFYDANTKDVNWPLLAESVHIAVRFADNVINYTPYPFKENEKVQKEQRRIGMGTMGLADLLIDLGLRYGSPESLVLIEKLYSFIKNEAYRASALLAKMRCKFDTYDEKLLSARIPASLDDDVKELISKYGLRNSHLLTQAPTGTTATKTGRRGYSVGTGVEPFFALEWTRTSRMSTSKDFLGKAKDWLDEHPGQELPDYFVSAMGKNLDGTPQITPTQHIDVQAAIQRHNDSCISKTINVPNDFSVKDAGFLYIYGFKAGVVGLTLYRDGSREVQVLNTYNEKDQELTEELKEAYQNYVVRELPVEPSQEKKFYKRPKRLKGETIKTPTPFGKAYVTVNCNDDDEIEEVFIKLGKTGADIAAISDGLAIALTGMISPRLNNLTQKEKVEWLIKKFRGISGANVVGFGPNRVESLPDAIAKVLQEITQTVVTPLYEEYDVTVHGGPTEMLKVYKEPTSTDLCPICGMSTFVRQDGCYTCFPDLGGCGYSKCS
jgi:ribonucleoside-diphosphate reductase alpha chain